MKGGISSCQETLVDDQSGHALPPIQSDSLDIRPTEVRLSIRCFLHTLWSIDSEEK